MIIYWLVCCSFARYGNQLTRVHTVVILSLLDWSYLYMAPNKFLHLYTGLAYYMNDKLATYDDEWWFGKSDLSLQISHFTLRFNLVSGMIPGPLYGTRQNIVFPSVLQWWKKVEEKNLWVGHCLFQKKGYVGMWPGQSRMQECRYNS